jgi:hypothetical protein
MLRRKYPKYLHNFAVAIVVVTVFVVMVVFFAVAVTAVVVVVVFVVVVAIINILKRPYIPFGDRITSTPNHPQTFRN